MTTTAAQAATGRIYPRKPNGQVYPNFEPHCLVSTAWFQNQGFKS